MRFPHPLSADIICEWPRPCACSRACLPPAASLVLLRNGILALLAAWSMMIIICTTATEDGRRHGSLPFGLLLPLLPPPPQWPSLLLPVGHAILAFLSFFPGREGGLQWPRQTLFGKQVTILSGSIFLPVPFPPRPRAQLQNFLNSNPSVEFNGASENEVPFHLPYLLPSIWLVCYKALVAFHNHSVSDLNCTAFHSPISPLSTLPPHLFVGPAAGGPLGWEWVSSLPLSYLGLGGTKGH